MILREGKKHVRSSKCARVLGRILVQADMSGYECDGSVNFEHDGRQRVCVIACAWQQMDMGA